LVIVFCLASSIVYSIYNKKPGSLEDLDTPKDLED
jgi:hypothetical protein